MSIAKFRFCLRCKQGKETEVFGKNKRGLPDVLCQKCRHEKDSETNVGRKIKNLAARHKISVSEVQALFDKADGKCEICQKPFEKLIQYHLDINHETGKPRGVLCVGCNSGLGTFHDSAIRLEAAAAYLKRYSTTDDFVNYAPLEKNLGKRSNAYTSQ